jgi:putative transposase
MLYPKHFVGQALWLYYRFNPSHRDIEDLLAERGAIVTRESIRLWCIKFEAIYTRPLKRKHSGYGDTFFIDEVFKARRDGAAAKRFFKRLLHSHGAEPRKIVTDKLRGYGVAHRGIDSCNHSQYPAV